MCMCLSSCQAAALANTLEHLLAREEAAQEELREGERGYDAAEARKGSRPITLTRTPTPTPTPDPNPTPTPSP